MEVIEVKKKIVFIVLTVIIIGLISYVLIGGAIIKNKMNDYLIDKGYLTNEIENIKVSHSFINVLLSYNEWNITVKYADEPEVLYFYTYKNKEIVTNGIGGAGAEKDNLKHDTDYRE